MHMTGFIFKNILMSQKLAMNDFNLFLKDIQIIICAYWCFISLSVCVCSCVYACVCVYHKWAVHREQKRTLVILGLEIQMSVSCHMCARN